MTNARNYTRLVGSRYVSETYAGPAGKERILIARKGMFAGGWSVVLQELKVVDGRECWDTFDVLATRYATLREAKAFVADHFSGR